MIRNFFDSLKNLVDPRVNERNAHNTNCFQNRIPMKNIEKQAIFKMAIGHKACNIKANYALNNTIQFESDDIKKLYNRYVANDFIEAAEFMFGFGRGILVIIRDEDEDLSTPMVLDGPLNPARTKIRVYADDSVTVPQVNRNLVLDRYFKPESYTVYGKEIHHSRVVDLTHIKPTIEEINKYNYGGISLFQIAYEQLISDAVVQRAIPTILDKSSNMFYKVKDLKNTMAAQKDASFVTEYFQVLEKLRSNYGAGILDADDDASVLQQNLSGVKEYDEIIMRRLALAFSIPLSILIGENVKGLNSTGDNELKIFYDHIVSLQTRYFMRPLQEIFDLFGWGDVQFKENQGESPIVKVDYDLKVTQVATALFNMGHNPDEYLTEKGLISKNKPKDFFALPEGEQEEQEEDLAEDDEQLEGEQPEASEDSSEVDSSESIEDVVEEIQQLL